MYFGLNLKNAAIALNHIRKMKEMALTREQMLTKNFCNAKYRVKAKAYCLTSGASKPGHYTLISANIDGKKKKRRGKKQEEGESFPLSQNCHTPTKIHNSLNQPHSCAY